MMTLMLALLLFPQDAQERYVVMMTKGPKWKSEKELDPHVKYWTELADKGIVVLGGPFADGSGGMLVLKTATKEEAEKLAKEDPAVKAEMLRAEVKAWKVVLKEKTNPLLDPEDPRMNQKAPDEFKVKIETTRGAFVIKVVRSWSPNGADRFYNLVKAGYYDGTKFFRVLKGFVAQFGIHGDPKISKAWREATIRDDPVVQSNKRGFVTYATGGPDTRTTQLFINYGDNSRLDGMGFSPFGEVVEGMDVVDGLYNEYGEGAPRGKGPDQGRIQRDGNAYLDKEYPKLDAIKTAKVVE